MLFLDIFFSWTESRLLQRTWSWKTWDTDHQTLNQGNLFELPMKSVARKVSPRPHLWIRTASHDLPCSRIQDRWDKLADCRHGQKRQPSLPGEETRTFSKMAAHGEWRTTWGKNFASRWSAGWNEIITDKISGLKRISLKSRENF